MDEGAPAVRVNLLEEYIVERPTVFCFQDGDRLRVPAGRYYTSLLGVVIDLGNPAVGRRSRASARAAWKLNPPPRFTRRPEPACLEE